MKSVAACEKEWSGVKWSGVEWLAYYLAGEKGLDGCIEGSRETSNRARGEVPDG